jgi:hypothetical protein
MGTLQITTNFNTSPWPKAHASIKLVYQVARSLTNRRANLLLGIILQGVQPPSRNV